MKRQLNKRRNETLTFPGENCLIFLLNFFSFNSHEGVV
jgi:hypothetical protein